MGKKILLTILNKTEELISGLALFVMLILTTINSLLRYIISWTIPGVDEIVMLCFTWATFMATSACYKRNMHYGVDILSNTLPIKGRHMLSLITHLILLGACGYLTYLAWKLSILGLTSRYTAFYEIPYFWIDLSAVLCFFFMTISTVRFLLKDIKGEVGVPLVTDKNLMQEEAD